MTARTREALTNRARSSKPWFEQDMVDLVDTIFSLDNDAKKAYGDTIKTYLSKNVNQLIQNVSSSFDIKGEGFLKQIGGNWIFDASEYITKEDGDSWYSKLSHFHNHDSIKNRDAVNSHPFRAISGVLLESQFPLVSGDVENVEGSTDLSVTGLGGYALPTLGVSPGSLRWSGAGWVLDEGAAGAGVHNDLTGRSDLNTHPFSSLSGVLGNTQFPALSGDVSNTVGTVAITVNRLSGQALPAFGVVPANFRWNGSAWTMDTTAYAAASSLGNYVLKTGDAMTGGLSIGISGTTPISTGAAVPLSVSTADYCDILIKSTSATKDAAIGFITASASGSGWGIGKQDDGRSGMPVAAFGAWYNSVPKFWVTSALASFRVPLDTTGNFTAPSATIGSSTAILKRTAGVLGDAVAADFPTLNQSTTGNAATATKWANPITLTIGATGKSLDGSGPLSYSFADIFSLPAGIVAYGHSTNGLTGSVNLQFTGTSLNLAGTTTLSLGSAQISNNGSSAVALYGFNRVWSFGYGSGVALPGSPGTYSIAAAEGAYISGTTTLASLSSGGLVRADVGTGNLSLADSSYIKTKINIPQDEIVFGQGASGLGSSSGFKFNSSTGAATINGAIEFKYSAADPRPSSIQRVYNSFFSPMEYRVKGPNAYHRFYVMQDDLVTEATRLQITKAGGILDGEWSAPDFFPGRMDCYGVTKLGRVVVTTATYELPVVEVGETRQIIFDVGNCDVSTNSSQGVSLRRDTGALGNEAAGTTVAASFGKTGARMRSIFLVGVSSTQASIIG